MDVNQNIIDDIEFGSIAVELELLSDEELINAIRRWLGQSRLTLTQVLEQDCQIEFDDLQLALALLAERRKQGSTVSRGNSQTDEPSTKWFDDLTREQPADRMHDSRFERRRQLAQGGLGIVYEGHDHELNRMVAIKELNAMNALDPWARERFFRESSVTASLEHPSIIPIHGRGVRDDGTPYYAMRIIQGKTLRDLVDDYHSAATGSGTAERMEFRKLIGHLILVAQAVEYAHSKNVIHRDLKPSNVVVGKHGETMLIDWGLARIVNEDDRTYGTSESADSSPVRTTNDAVSSSAHNQADLTLDGTAVGTLAYMSPEQACGDRCTGRPTDVYGLGAILFYILTGSPPREADTVSERIELACRGSFDSHKLNNNSAPRQLIAICTKALSTDSTHRYASAASIIADLENYLAGEPVSACPETPWQKLRRWAQTHQTMVAAGLASLLVSLLAMGLSLSILASNNESLRLANQRESMATRQATKNLELAERNGEEALQQRQKVLGILKTFLLDVERGLADVPGGAAVQRNVLKTILQKLSELSPEFSSNEQLHLSNALALIDLGELFTRAGTSDIAIDLPRWNLIAISPLAAADAVYEEAMKIAKRNLPRSEMESRALIALILHKQADIRLQSAHTAEAVQMFNESLSLRKAIYADSPSSKQATIDLVATLDALGRIYLQNGDLSNAKQACAEASGILANFTQELPLDMELKRLQGVNKSRLADIAVRRGELELAASLYEEDLAIAQELYHVRPDDLTTKRELCTSLDRISNISSARGQAAKALELCIKSLQLRLEIHAAEPESLQAIHELIVSYMKCGDLRMSLDHVDAARGDYEKALMLSDEMAQLDPANAIAKRFQSLSAEVLADVSLQQDQLPEALAYAQQSLAISQTLYDLDPTDLQKQRDLYLGNLKVAKVLISQEAYEECLGQLNLALPIVRSGYDQQPDSLVALRDYNVVQLRIAEVQLASGNPQAAAEQCQAVISLMESFPETNRQDAISRRRLVNALTMLGRAHLASEDSEQAAIPLQRARELAEQMIMDEMRVEQMQLDLSEIESLLSSM